MIHALRVKRLSAVFTTGLSRFKVSSNEIKSSLCVCAKREKTHDQHLWTSLSHILATIRKKNTH